MKTIKRVVDTGFWNDDKVLSFTPEDKFFFLFLLTNEYTSQLGIYHLPVAKAVVDLGYSKETVLKLLKRMEEDHKVIKISKKTGEIAIKNYLIYSVVRGGQPVLDCLKKDEKAVIDKSLVDYVIDSTVEKIEEGREINTTVVDFIHYMDGVREKRTKKENVYINDNNNDNDNDNDNERIVHESSKKAVVLSNKNKNLIVEQWNNAGFKRIVGLKPSSKRYDHLVARIKEYGIDSVFEAIKRASESDYLHTAEWFKFDWFVLPSNFPKVLEGNYDDRDKQKNNSQSKWEGLI